MDPDKLGVYGHSMGGKLTVMTAAADNRVKAAAPSCGGISDRHSKFPLYRSTIQDGVSLKRITCPVMFLNPSNDFHARFHDLPTALEEIQTDTWRITSSPHHNHQDTAEYQVAGPLWFDQVLKETFTFPQTPKAIWNLRTSDGTPHISVQVDSTIPILSVDVFYTQQGQPAGEENDRENTIHRFWHHVAPEKSGRTWETALPISRLDKPLWAYANVTYALREPVTGAGYYYAPYTANSFVLSSPVLIAPPEQLTEAGAAANQLRSLVIEDFSEGWEKEWFSYRTENWGKRTNKIYDERWHAPVNARLALEVLCTKPNSLVIGIDQYATEVQLTGGGTWQSVTVSKDQFLDALGAGGLNWAAIRQLRLESKLTLRSNKNGENQTRTFGGQWKGEDPQFRNLRWLPANGE